MLRSACLFCLLSLLVGPPARAGDIYMGVDGAGNITFTDTPNGVAAFSLFLEDLAGRPAEWAAIDEQLLRRNVDRFDPIILRAASRSGLSAELIKAVILVESGFNPTAESPAGAYGLMQLMPATARGLGVEDRADPMDNVLAGSRYLARLLRRYDGDLALGLAGYNAGPGNVDRYGGIPPFEETQYYVEKVTRYYAYFQEHRPVGSRPASR